VLLGFLSPCWCCKQGLSCCAVSDKLGFQSHLHHCCADAIVHCSQFELVTTSSNRLTQLDRLLR
jgi:hypothetical protein